MLAYEIADLKEFNRLLNKAKGKRKWVEVSKICGLSVEAVLSYRNGTRRPTGKSLMKLTLLVPREKGNELYNQFLGCTKECQDMEEYRIGVENRKYRKNGFKGTSIRSLFAAACIQACVDFRKARSGSKTVDGRPAAEVAEECHKFFGSPIFRTESGQSSVEYIEKCIMRTKPGDLQWLWRQNKAYRKPGHKSQRARPKDPKTGRFAKNTTPIIEGL